MKVVFVISEAENYAVMYFSSLLKKQGHEVYLIIDPRLFANDEINNRLGKWFDMRQHNVEKIKEIKPDLIAFSVYTQDYKWALSMARTIKSSMDARIVFGGVHCVLCPEEVIKEDCIDWVCASEGEDVIVDLVNNLDTPPGILVQEQLTNLETLPLPDRSLFYDQYPLFKHGLTIATSRGCPYRCTYCASEALNELYNHKYLRQRSVDSVIGELYVCQERYKSGHVHFTDDNIVLNTNWLRDFTRDYKRFINLPFFCTCNPGTVSDTQVILLKEAGCQLVGFGMQSCDEAVRLEILQRPGTNKHIREITQLCHSIGLNFSFDHIFNLPTETLNQQYAAIYFYSTTRPVFVNTFDLIYLPKTKLTKQMLKGDSTADSRTSMYSTTNNRFASIFALIPFLPKRVIGYISRNLDISFPFWFRLLLKDLARARIGRWSDIFFPLQLLLTNVSKITKEKYGI